MPPEVGDGGLRMAGLFSWMTISHAIVNETVYSLIQVNQPVGLAALTAMALPIRLTLVSLQRTARGRLPNLGEGSRDPTGCTQ